MDRDSGDRYDATRGSGTVYLRRVYGIQHHIFCFVMATPIKAEARASAARATAKKMSLQKNHPSQPRYSQEATKKQKGGDRVFACTFRVLRGPAGPVFCVFVFWAGPQGLCFVFLCFGPALRACVLCFRVLAAPPQNTARRQKTTSARCAQVRVGVRILKHLNTRLLNTDDLLCCLGIPLAICVRCQLAYFYLLHAYLKYRNFLLLEGVATKWFAHISAHTETPQTYFFNHMIGHFRSLFPAAKSAPTSLDGDDDCMTR
jgi:hypothetical protein